jgi:hypothetical protein
MLLLSPKTGIVVLFMLMQDKNADTNFTGIKEALQLCLMLSYGFCHQTCVEITSAPCPVTASL